MELRNKIVEILQEYAKWSISGINVNNYADKILDLINNKSIEIDIEHKQCHSCVSWICANELGSFCNHKLIKGINKDGKCGGYERR